MWIGGFIILLGTLVSILPFREKDRGWKIED
jgi:hypothetical protein